MEGWVSVEKNRLHVSLFKVFDFYYSQRDACGRGGRVVGIPGSHAVVSGSFNHGSGWSYVHLSFHPSGVAKCIPSLIGKLTDSSLSNYNHSAWTISSVTSLSFDYRNENRHRLLGHWA